MQIGRKVVAVSAVAATLLAMSACGNSSDTSSEATVDTSDASGTINFWGWDSGNAMDDILAKFEKKYPKIKVKFNNTGTAADTATALQNAISAGNGAPDVVMLEDPTVSQFAISKGLTDLSQFGADEYSDDYTAGPWSKVQVSGKPYALPIDSGPEMFFYNKKIFDKAGIKEAPKTWEEYYQDAKKIKAIGSYITNNAGDSNSYQPFTAQAWQAGAQPWKVNGEKLTINMTNDAGMKKYIDFQQKLIDEKLIDTKTANWSDDWNRGLNDGSIASLTIGAWMPVNLKSGAPDQKGNWRVAQMPQWEEGQDVGAEDGGSALSITEQSKNKAAAWKLIEYFTHDAEGGAKQMRDTGTFPALKKLLNDSAFTDEKDDYFGGQQVNKVLVEAANKQVTKFQYLPYNPYAQSTYGDSIGKAYQGQTTLAKAMADYQSKLVAHGEQEGYSVNK